MDRYHVFNGWVFGIDDDHANRLRFARPFGKPDKHDYIEVPGGAITGLYDAGPHYLGIQCGSTIFYLSGSSISSFTIRERTGPERWFDDR